MTNLDGKIAALLILLIAMFQGASMKKAKKEAYATILSSDSFLLAVRVLGMIVSNFMFSTWIRRTSCELSRYYYESSILKM